MLNKPRYTVKAVTLALVLTLLQPGLSLADHHEDEAEHANRLGFIGGTHIGGTLGALIPEPTAAFFSEVVAYTSGLTLKNLSASFVEPGDVIVTPDSGDMCTYDLNLPQGEAVYSNIFGLPNPLSPFPSDWGDLGDPQIFHFNTEVAVTVHNNLLRPTNGPALTQVDMPAGVHTINWQADTILDLGLDFALPTFMLAMSYSKFKAAKSAPAAASGNADEAAKQAGVFKRAGKWMVEKLGVAVRAAGEKAVETYVLGLIDDATDWEIVSASKSYPQTFTVYDIVPPVITYDGIDQVDNAVLPTITFEATDFGGVALHRIEDQLRARAGAYDPCDRAAGVSHDLPHLIRLGANQTTWTSTDFGPTPSGINNSVTATQTIIVEDTQAPIMITPPGKVIEIEPAQGSVDAEDVVLGVPRVVDLADPAPRVFSDAPASFPLNSRTPVTWTVEDQSGNQNSGDQLITVKEIGSNTAPTADDIQAQTLTSQPIDIVLTGADQDELDGMFDPLAINLESRPANGDFVAPLMPFFIEDFRSTPEGPFGPEFGFLTTHNERDDWLWENRCTNPDYSHLNSNIRIERGWVYTPAFIHVQDNGEYFMIDRRWQCDMPGTRARTWERISKWSAEDEYLGEVDYNGTSNTFVVDQDGLLYTLSRTGSGSSSTLFLAQRPTNFEDPDFDRNNILDSWRFDYASTDNRDTGVSHSISPGSLSYARVDSNNHLIFLTDRRRVFVFDVREDFTDGVEQNDNSMEDKYLGALHNGEQFLCNGGQHGNSWTGFAMDVDADGNLYVTDTCDNQIHKFTPSYFDDNGDFVMGEHVGWMGRCDTSTNDACDEENGRSRGYACTDATCPLPAYREEDGVNRIGTWGDEPGQFAGPVFIDLDPNGVLYVGDTGRVQRFATDGTFGGQAKSTGTGINQGDHPEFILGNMGTVKAVTVNSTHFFVVDQAESFIHVFETTPLKDITDSSATVTYVSNFNFHSGTDTFTYSATDGLDTSNIATVSVQVDRNFRPPEAFGQDVTLDEDTEAEITVTGDDPDGVFGTDDVFPLDNLTFRVTTQPEFGSVSLVNDLVTYTPDTDYHGEDSFQFVANDGVFDSEPATVNLTINSVEDAPVLVEVMPTNRAARGFPVALVTTYTDDGGEFPADGYVVWGDGAMDARGDFEDPDGEGGEPPELVGAKFNEPAEGIGEGNILAQHVYQTTGMMTSQVCIVTDAEHLPCENQTIEVQELVSLEVSVSEDPDETTASFIDLDIEIENAVPQGWSGLTANNVALNQVAVEEADVTQIISQSGSACSLSNGLITCSDPSMAPGDTITATIRLARAGTAPLIYDLGVPFAIDVTTSTPAIEDMYTGIRWIRFLADATDTDGDGMTDVFEQTYGLNPAFAGDASLDGDGDQLTNLEEFERRTDPTLADSDADGINDNEDFCPLDPGGTVEGHDGLCEAEIQSNAVLRIINILGRERN